MTYQDSTPTNSPDMSDFTAMSILAGLVLMIGGVGFGLGYGTRTVFPPRLEQRAETFKIEGKLQHVEDTYSNRMLLQFDSGTSLEVRRTSFPYHLNQVQTIHYRMDNHEAVITKVVLHETN